jgi:hydroxyacylglutathione hydrolase
VLSVLVVAPVKDFYFERKPEKNYSISFGPAFRKDYKFTAPIAIGIMYILKSTKKPMLTIKSFVFSPVQENTYILYNDKKECCIIDPGCYFPEERDTLTSFIRDQGLKPILLLNTHCHLDHVFGNKFIFDKWGLIPHIHPKEKPVLDFAGIAGAQWQLPFDNYEGELKWLKEGTHINIGNDAMEIRFTPGHSPGSVAFYYEPGNFVIGGDVLFNGSVGRTDLPGGDFDTLFQSIQTQFFTLPDDTKVYSGHGPVTTIGLEKMNNPFVKVF